MIYSTTSKKINRRLVFIIIFLSTTRAVAIDFELQQDIRLSYIQRSIRPNYVENMANSGLAEYNLNFEMNRESASLYVSPQFRFLTSDNVNPDDFDNLSIVAPKRKLGLVTKDYETSRDTFNGSIEQLYETRDYKGIQFRYGRMPLASGFMSMVPVSNRYVALLPTPNNFIQFNTVDAIEAFYEKNNSTLRVFNIFNENSHTFITEFTNYNSLANIMISAGTYFDNLSFVFGVNKEVLGGNLKFEYLQTGLNNADEINEVIYAFGYDRALSAKLKFNMEFLVQDKGASDEDQYLETNLNRIRNLLARYYSVTQLEYSVTDFSTFDLTHFYNIIDKSSLLSGRYQYSTSDNSNLVLQLFLATGGKNEISSGRLEEFSPHPIRQFGVSVRNAPVTNQLSMSWEYFF